MWVLFPLGRCIACDEHSRREHSDVGKLKPAPRLARHRLQGAHSEAPQEATTVIGLSLPTHTVPLVGETPATLANHQVTHVVRVPQLWLWQWTERAQVARRSRHLQLPFRESAPPRSVSWGFGWHGEKAYGKPSLLSSMPTNSYPGIMLNRRGCAAKG